MLNLTEYLFFDTKSMCPDPNKKIEVCNLGSSMGKFSFDYSQTEMHGANFASSPQSLFYDFKLLRRNLKFLKPRAWVLIPICPFSSIRTPYPAGEHYVKYYPVLAPEDIPDYSGELAEKINKYLKQHPDIADPALAYDQTLSAAEMEMSVKNLLSCWGNEFAITDFNIAMSEKNRQNFILVVQELKSMLAFCLAENLRPVLIITPISKYYADIFTPQFWEQYVYDFIVAANTAGVPLLDYAQEPDFSADGNFMNSLLLNKSARRRFTARVLSDLTRLEMDEFFPQQLELKNYYRKFSCNNVKIPFNPLWAQMEQFAADHPQASAMELKAAQYEIIAENFQPVLFRYDPFFYETGLKVAEYNGRRELSSGGWLLLRNEHLYRDISPVDWQRYQAAGRAGLHLTYGPYCDYDHHCFPFSNILKYGLCGMLERLRCGKAQNPQPDLEFYAAAERGILAAKKIADKFAAAAEAKIVLAADEAEKVNLRRIAAVAGKIPWYPAETFFEGLACLRFLYEIGSVLDGVGMSVIGAPDSMPIELYENDLALGRITREDARDLICRFLVQTDCKLSPLLPIREQFNAGEQGDTLILGGVDEAGRVTSNELSQLFLQAHETLKLIYPKIHCRISSGTPDNLLLEMAKPFIQGRNVIAFLNDDVLIPAQCAAGKSPRDAARYVAGGCWEVIVEGSEHSEGANNYFSMGKIMDCCIHPADESMAKSGMKFELLDGAGSFDEAYKICLDNTRQALAQMLKCISRNGRIWPLVNPAPFFSACLDGCAESGVDYSNGGARYSPHGLPLTGMAIFIDSLLAIKELCFDRKIALLPDLLRAVRSNWRNDEVLRLKAQRSPHFGDGDGAGAALAKRVLDEICDFVATFSNERNAPYQCGLYSYSDVVQWATLTRATPDGRKCGDFLAQGINPTRLHVNDISSVFRDVGRLPLERFPANSVITLSMSRYGLTAELLKSFLKAWTISRAGGMLQLNCITRDELEDADKNPAAHRDLVVRLYGYSARYVTLDEERKAEFKSRNLF